MTKRIATMELKKEDMSFSAGHFTIFSATEREPLHGHNYNAAIGMTFFVSDNGMSFDYRFYKDKMRELCREIDQIFLLPEKSEFLRYEYHAPYTYVLFGDERIPFLARDIKFLPVTNITVEELSNWFVDRFFEDESVLLAHEILSLDIKIYSGAGQWGSTRRVTRIG